MNCQTQGCAQATTYGGRCPACEILFGPYDRVLEVMGAKEVEWFAPVVAEDEEPPEDEDPPQDEDPPEDEKPAEEDAENLTTADTY